MKNENCLKGVMCPKCGHTESFDVVATCVTTVTDEGTDNERNIEWDSSSPLYCTQCQHDGRFGEFTRPGFDVTFEVYTPLAYEMGEPDRRGWWMPGEWLHDEHPGEPAFDFDPDDFDPEEHDTLEDAIVEWAVSLLKREGAIHPNETPSENAEWWGTEDEVLSYETGEQIAKQFHFKGFDERQLERINRRMRA